MDAGELIQSRYELTEPLGRGGMAEVWLAQDSHLGRPVAIKFLAPQLSADPEFLVRFFSEAQAVARISHPNVVRVLDFGEYEEAPYLVMEHVGGGPLTDKVGEPHEPDWAFEVMADVARAAGVAHAHGVVHRDIKPGNILLDVDGRAKLADFGIASSGISERLTATGAAIGSPHYISPEQAQGRDATPASDVYALGIVLYELLTGVRPFEADNITAIAIAHVEQEPAAPSIHVPELDPAIDSLVLRCLDKDPSARFEDGAEMAAALEQFDLPPVAPIAVGIAAVRNRGWPRKRIAVAAAVVTALGVVPLLGVLASGEDTVSASVDDGSDAPLPNVGGLKIKKSPSPSTTARAPISGARPTPTTKEERKEERQRQKAGTNTTDQTSEEATGEQAEPTPEPTSADPTPEPEGSPSP